MNNIFWSKLDQIQPSQLYISSVKLNHVLSQFDPQHPEPLPIKQLGDRAIFTDGHTRALAALLHGLSEIPVYWDEDDLDWEAYQICVDWCKEEGIHNIADLQERVIPPQEYERRWLDRCREMQKNLAAERGQTR